MVKDCGVVNGNAVCVSERLRGGGVHKGKKQTMLKNRKNIQRHELPRHEEERDPSEDLTKE